MKRFLSPEPGGGVPVTNELLYLLQSEPLAATATLLGAVADSWIVDGCTVISVNPTAKTCSLTGGHVFLQGELRALDYVSSAYPLYIIPATDTYDTEVFSNGAVQNYLVTKKATTTTVKPTGVPYLVIDPSQLGGDDSTNKRIRPLLNGDVTAALQAEIANRLAAEAALRQAVVDEATTRQNADTQLQSNINALPTTVAKKQDRVTTKIAWQDITLTNSYYSSTENLNDTNTIGLLGTKYNKFQIMRDEDGFVHVRGYLTGNGGGTVVNQNGLPQEFRPTHPVQFNVSYCVDGNSTYPGKMQVFHTLEFDEYGGITHVCKYSQALSANDPGGQKLNGIHPFLLVDGFNYSVE